MPKKKKELKVKSVRSPYSRKNSKDYVVVDQAKNDEYFWTVKSGNHRKIGTTGETYKRHAYAVDMASRITGLDVYSVVDDG